MKRSMLVILAVGVIAVISVGAYAHGDWGNYGRSYGDGHMMGWNPGYGHMMGNWGAPGGHGYCGGWAGWNTPEQPATVPQVISEDKVKEIAETYVAQYLPGYTVGAVEKDSWRPMYFVNLQGENGAELQLWIHGFGGQVMHIVPKPVK